MEPDTVVEEKITKAKPAPKKGKGKKVYIGVDNTPQDVLDCVQDGCDLFFGDGEAFLKLPSDIYKELPLAAKERYTLAHELTLNGINSVIGTVTDGLNGWDRDYDVQPGTPGEKLAIFNKAKDQEYRWARPDKIGKYGTQGFEVDRDPNVKTFGQPTSEVGKAVPKAVGGRVNSELILMRRRKDVGAEFRKKQAAKQAAYTTRAKDSYKEDVIKAGGKPTEE